MSFSLQTTLFRYIRKEYRRRNRVVFVEAFVEEQGSPLSVNSLTVESRRDIARYYANAFEDSRPSRVAVSSAKLSKYNKAGEKAGMTIRYEGVSRQWIFFDRRGKSVAAYTLTNHDKSPSHAHVQFVRNFNETDAKKFAREMARLGFVTVNV